MNVTISNGAKARNTILLTLRLLSAALKASRSGSRLSEAEALTFDFRLAVLALFPIVLAISFAATNDLADNRPQVPTDY